MEGSLKEIHLGGLLRLLTLHRFTGALHLEDEGKKGIIYLNSGRILGAVKSPNDQPIGQRLIKAGLLTPTLLEDALNRQKSDPHSKPIGHYLTKGVTPLVNPTLFKQILEDQTTDHVVELLRLTSGTFSFTDGELAFEDFPLTMCTENLILKSFRSFTEAKAVDALPPGSAIMEWAPRPEGTSLDLSLTANEWNTLILFDGDRNLESALQMAPQGKATSAVSVNALIAAGLLKKVRFRFPDVERICQEEFGNMGLVLVRNAYQKVGVSRARMGMRELLRILNDLDKAMSLIVGPTKTAEVIQRLWEATKR
jgi:hypothetical protein